MQPRVSSWRSSRSRLIISSLQVLVIFMKMVSSQSHNHLVGGSIWSIPVSNDYYITWSSNQSFFVGDNLVLSLMVVAGDGYDSAGNLCGVGFDTGLYDVKQVSRREFENCSAENAFRTFEIGPATVSLIEEGMHYFICSFGNYCFLGLKVSVQVWIFFPNLWPHFFSPRILHGLGLLFGRPLKVDNATTLGSCPSVAQFLVEIDVTQKYSDKIWLGPMKLGYFQQVVMEDFPPFCVKCKRLGHSIDSCYPSFDNDLVDVPSKLSLLMPVLGVSEENFLQLGSGVLVDSVPTLPVSDAAGPSVVELSL
ncbi:hypothetical protein KFK09_028828 [Dendrobium nobile]|uniref:Phytocyanin domain-containing protein n=1 Tax=Dendrobium nobile TaxID=94219 RepID=A0A8T3A447_DENNO|nr:hypothetical protein KFK09_028828 [Dendrobium nobile]